MEDEGVPTNRSTRNIYTYLSCVPTEDFGNSHCIGGGALYLKA